MITACRPAKNDTRLVLAFYSQRIERTASVLRTTENGTTTTN